MRIKPQGNLLSRARDVHLLFGREFTAFNFSVSITIIIVNYYHSKVNYYHSRAHHVTCKQLPTNNGLLMCNAVQQCLAANNILLMRKGNRAFLLLAIALA